VRIALDTNVLVSAVATRGLCADVFNLVLAEHQLIVGEAVLAEVQKTKAVSIKIRDKSDMPVLAEAIAGKAEVLVTGDKDFHEIAGKVALDVLTPRGLWERLRAPSGEHYGTHSTFTTASPRNNLGSEGFYCLTFTRTL
jgi:uncharacterized protein